MATVPAFQAKTRFGELLDRVAEGEEIIITRHDKPVARLIAEGKRSLADIRRAGEGLKALQKEIAANKKVKAPETWEKFKAFVEAGRE